MIPEYVIDQILSKDIVSIIGGEGVSLKRAGVNYECCCPFHKEKTPSFKVSPVKGIFTCFGCSAKGNAISFVMMLYNMTFPEAVEYLAKKLNIEYKAEELTPEQKEARFRRSRIFEINQIALEYFRESYKQSLPAQKYATKERGFKEETIDNMLIGFAPYKGGFREYATQKGYKEQLLIDADLVRRSERDGSLYDTFRGRLMFTIRDRTGNIVGFSGRLMDKENPKKLPKYINTGDTAVYKKGEHLFAYFESARQAAAVRTMNLVEGNPDAIRMHQIGVDNTVAPLGTALTPKQIELIKKVADTVIIIGDMDDAGQKAVVKNAETMLREGLAVRVMEIKDNYKDPDDYFRQYSKGYEELLSNSTTDFIPWLCAHKMEGKNSQTEQIAVISEVCQLLALCRDESTVNMYLDMFAREYKNRKIWTAELQKIQLERERAQRKKEESYSEDMISEYGFYISHNSYYGAGRGNADVRWSNFILEPIVHVKDDQNARRLFRMRNDKGEEAVIKLDQRSLVSFADFRIRTESKGNYIWEAGQGELTKLKKYLFDGTPSADEIKQLGWQKRHQIYAWGNGAMDEGHFVKANDFGLVNVRGQLFYLPGCSKDTADDPQSYQFQRRFVYAITNDITLNDYATRLIEVFGDNAKVGLCFLIASLFRDLVVNVTTSFPILNLFGPKGSGKSELAHSLTSFFIPSYIAPNINNTTKAALAEAVAEVSNAIVHIDEYKNTLDIEKREFLKGLWDGAGRSRMNMDNDKKRETTAVDCGVILSGQEMPTADIALFSRLVFLTFSKTTFSDDEKRRYNELKLIEKRGLTHLTGGLLKHRNQFRSNYRHMYDETAADFSVAFVGKIIEDRTFRNWVSITAAFRSIEHLLHLPFTYTEILPMVTRMCETQNLKTNENNELAGFWETVDILASSGKIWIGVDYHIKASTKKGIPIKESKTLLELPEGTRYLSVSFLRISQLYAKESRDSESKKIPRDSLKYYLEHSREFLGTKKAERFKVIQNPTGFVPAGDAATGRTTTAMLFDYKMICENYGIDLDTSRSYTENPDEPDEPEPFTPTQLSF